MLKTFLNTLETMKGTMHFKTRTGSRLCYYCQLGTIFLIATASKNGRLLDISLGGVLYPTNEPPYVKPVTTIEEALDIVKSGRILDFYLSQKANGLATFTFRINAKGINDIIKRLPLIDFGDGSFSIPLEQRYIDIVHRIPAKNIGSFYAEPIDDSAEVVNLSFRNTMTNAEYEKLIIDGVAYVEDKVPFYETLKGLTLKSVRRDVTPDRESYFSIDDRENIVMEAEDGRLFILYHAQDCCESVSLEDVVGDLEDLVGSPILEAECVSNIPEQGWLEEAGAQTEYEDSFTWTYYKFATIKGHVNLRWYGSSNGYYSESVQELVVKPLEVKPDVLT